MKQTISMYDFERAFVDHNRSGNFTYAGLKALYDWFEELDDSCGTETELDVIAICCEFTEYEDLAEFHGVYDKEEYPDIDTLTDHTSVIYIDGTSFIIQDF